MAELRRVNNITRMRTVLKRVATQTLVRLHRKRECICPSLEHLALSSYPRCLSSLPWSPVRGKADQLLIASFRSVV